MDEKARGSSGGVKLILVSAGVIIVLLVVMKQLNLNPSEVTTGAVGVKFQPLVTPQQQVTPEATAELEKKSRNCNKGCKAPIGHLILRHPVSHR
jgi:hypothetical protein